MYYFKLLCFGCCYFLIPWLTIAQSVLPTEQLYYQHFSTENGLSENVVYALHQDEMGFLWIGTDHGLNRYDGYQFTKYYRNLKDSLSLPHNSIYALVPDSDKHLWLATGSGLSCFDTRTGTATNYFVEADKTIGVLDIKWFSETELIIYTINSTFYLFNTKIRFFSKIQWLKTANTYINFKFWKLKNVEGVGMGLDGNYPITYYQINRSGIVEQRNPLIKGGASKSLNYVFETPNGYRALLYHDASIEVWKNNIKQQQTLLTKKQDTKSPFTTAAHLSTPNSTWMATTIGLLQMDHATGRVSTVQLLDENSSNDNTTKNIKTLLLDKENNLWIGTFGEGLLKVKLTPPVFKNLPLKKLFNQKSQSVIFSLKEWQDQSIVVSRADQTFTRILKNGALTYESKRNYSLKALLQNEHHINFDQVSVIQQQILQDLHNVNPTLSNNIVLQGDTATIEWGASGIVLRRPNHTKAIFSGPVNAFCKDKNYYWWGTAMGLLRTKKDFSNQILFQATDQLNSLSENVIGHMIMDEKNNLWIGTRGGGLNYYNQADNTFKQYSIEEGLPDNVIYHILPDNKGNLWLNTNRGLCKFNIATQTCRNFSKKDGLINDEFNRDGGLIASNGNMYFSGTSGIDYIASNAVLPENVTNPIQLEKVEVNGLECALPNLLNLNYKQNNITIAVTTNNFNYPEQIYFRYRLNNGRWDKIRGNNKIHLYALSPGEYKVEIQAGFDNYNWTAPKLLSFTIAAPWWQTIWFYALLLATIACILALLYQYRVKQFKKTIALRTQLARDLHDDVGASLSSIHIYSSVAEKLFEQNPDKAKSVLQQINANSRHAVENMNDIIWAMNTNFDEHALEKKLKNFGYDMLTPLNIHCVYDIEAAAETKLSAVNARKQMLLICKEAINNMAKYSRATEATIALKIVGEEMVLAIIDNGKGFDIENAVSGNGLTNIKDRTAALGGMAIIQSQPNQGTTITCTFQLATISDDK